MRFAIFTLILVFTFGFFACKSSAPQVVQETANEIGEEEFTGLIDFTENPPEEEPGETTIAEQGLTPPIQEEVEPSEPPIAITQAEPLSASGLVESPPANAPAVPPPANAPAVPPPANAPAVPPPASAPVEAPFAFPRVFPEAPEQEPLLTQSPIQEQRPVQEQAPTPRESPQTLPFVRPSEPEVPPPERQQVPAQDDSNRLMTELPSRVYPESPVEDFIFSRVVRLTVGQMLEIPFRGTGWVYLGELGNRRGLSYDSRRLDIQGGLAIGQSFIFRADASGTYILKFYKQDFIQDYIINDYVQVVVGERTEDSGNQPGSYTDRGRVVAEPRWPPVPEPEVGHKPSTAGQAVTESQPAEPQTAEPQAAGTQETAMETTPEPQISEATPSGLLESAAQANSAADVGFPADALPDEYVRRARQEFDAGRVEQALSILDLMKLRFPNGTDEAWWLYAQLLEANSPSRDIKLALEYYRRLIEEYPQSNRVGDARGRIAYLERFYINIR